MRFKPDFGNCKQFIINKTAPQYTTACSFIEGPNIKAVTSPSAVGRSLAVFVQEQGRRFPGAQEVIDGEVQRMIAQPGKGGLGLGQLHRAQPGRQERQDVVYAQGLDLQGRLPGHPLGLIAVVFPDDLVPSALCFRP